MEWGHGLFVLGSENDEPAMRWKCEEEALFFFQFISTSLSGCKVSHVASSVGFDLLRVVREEPTALFTAHAAITTKYARVYCAQPTLEDQVPPTSDMKNSLRVFQFR